MIDYHQIAVGVHLIGFALGLGGATISDIMFFKALRSKVISAEHFNFLHTLSKIIWAGLILLIASGAAMFALIYSEQGSLPLLASPRWQAKLILVAVVLINGFAFKYKIFPYLKSLIGSRLELQNIGSRITALTISGTISILSWYSILIISLLPRTVRPALYIFLGIYIALFIIGMVISRLVITRTLKNS